MRLSLKPHLNWDFGWMIHRVSDLKFSGQFLSMLDMGQMTPSQVQNYNKRLSPKMRRWAEPQKDSRLENLFCNWDHRSLVQFWKTPTESFLLHHLWALEIVKSSFSQLCGRADGAVSEFVLWTPERLPVINKKILEARTKFVEFRKRDNDELGLDNIFANYEDKNWGWILFMIH